MGLILNVLSLFFWVPSLSLKISLILLGLVMVPLTSNTHVIWGNNEHPEAPAWSNPTWPDWARQYWWGAIRNPANNLRYLFTEPEIDVIYGDENPDDIVRNGVYDHSERFVRSGIFSEFWYLRQVGESTYFEFRVGWKFSGVPGFAPTIQFRIGG